MNCTAVSLVDHNPGNEVVWDKPDFQITLTDADASFFDRVIPVSTDTASQRRFCRYISFYSGEEYIDVLSVYVSRFGTVGIEAHFTNISRLTGNRNGCVIHFPLRPKERIAYAWLRSLDYPAYSNRVL